MVKRIMVKAPDSLKEFVREEGVKAKLSELLELEDRLVPVFVTNPVPKNQADATLSQSSPTSGLKYTVLNETKFVRIIRIDVAVTWSGQPDPLEVHITIDGQSIRHFVNNPTTTQHYVCVYNPSETLQNQVLRAVNLDNEYRQGGNFLYEARSIKIEVETTGGTVSLLTARVKYAKW